MQKKRGRPRKYKDGSERMRAFRDRQRKKGIRVDFFISTPAAQRLDLLAAAWGCSKSMVVQRLLLETDIPKK